ncbi:hypothetical protein AMATHDRAFT_77804 [Amanita thiersii Skay4041]|uniref:Peptidoglycan-binding domain 1 protein n=1 Tax=Amanita thiersii Skay4041 TaxID=703135 RepID=A0A2A9N7P2_9AGAR|nr:hypothetical protein AMATHDRAFT_77804 [Amanita thiersii Skay4041]
MKVSPEYFVQSPWTVSAAPTDIESRSGVHLTQAQAEARLKPEGIYASSSGGCTDRNNPTCTSYEYILSGTVDAVITLKHASGSAITITGGTETGHASGTYSHWNGYKVDLHKTTTLNNYITTAFVRIANRGDGYPQWQAASGNIYCDEGTHWDVTVF